MKLETKILAIIEGKKTSPLIKALLVLMSQCYRAGVHLRHLAYDTIVPTSKLKVPVISVGNIVAGGTGKTPLVRYLAAEIAKSEKVGILTRGYRRKGTASHILVKDETEPRECGDEPYWLAKKVPDAKVIVGSDRVYTGYIAQVLDVKTILLDDGMQYRRLERDIEIGVMHADDLFGSGFYLPRGLLRDSPKRLAKAHLIVVNGVTSEEQYEKLEKEIRPYTSAPITAMQLQVENGSEIASKKIGVFCAIAAPKRFHNTLKTLGCEIVESLEKPDHLPFGNEELQHLANRAFDKGATALVCTEKDAVKLQENHQCRLPIIPLETTLSPLFGKEHLDQIITKVTEK